MKTWQTVCSHSESKAHHPDKHENMSLMNRLLFSCLRMTFSLESLLYRLTVQITWDRLTGLWCDAAEKCGFLCGRVQFLLWENPNSAEISESPRSTQTEWLEWKATMIFFSRSAAHFTSDPFSSQTRTTKMWILHLRSVNIGPPCP